MKDKSNQISIGAYNKFREKGVHKMLGDMANEDDDDDANAAADDKQNKQNKQNKQMNKTTGRQPEKKGIPKKKVVCILCIVQVLL